MVDPLPEDAPFFVKDYYAYYKTPRGYHPRSLNSNGGWNKIGCMSFMNMPQLTYTNEIRNAVLTFTGTRPTPATSAGDAYAAMTENSRYRTTRN